MSSIVLIGPVYPYKGGISHYTRLLCEALRKEHAVKMISYSMQYPRILFKKEQKEYDDESFKVSETEYRINTADPISWIKTAAYINDIRPTLVIIQWWHPYFSICYSVIARLIRKKNRILYTCHNVFPHERFPFDRVLTRMALSKGNCFIVHSKTDEEDLHQIVPRAIYRRTVIPSFNCFDNSSVDRNTARSALGIDANKRVLLFFGLVREYKGLKNLLNAVPIINKRISDVEVLIAGDFGGDKQQYLDIIAQNDIGKLVRIVDEYIPDSEVEKYFKASDITVLPYESATQSGIIQVSYSFGIPVVATSVGGIPEVVKDGKTGYLIAPKRPDLIADSVCDYFNNNRYGEFAENIKAESEKYSWNKMVEAIMEMG